MNTKSSPSNKGPNGHECPERALVLVTNRAKAIVQQAGEMLKSCSLPWDNHKEYFMALACALSYSVLLMNEQEFSQLSKKDRECLLKGFQHEFTKTISAFLTEGPPIKDSKECEYLCSIFDSEYKEFVLDFKERCISCEDKVEQAWFLANEIVESPLFKQLPKGATGKLKELIVSFLLKKGTIEFDKTARQ